MPKPARNPIRVAAAAATCLGLIAAACLPAGSSTAASSPAHPRTYRAQTTDAILPGLQVSGEENAWIGIGGTVPTNWVSVSGDDGQDGTGTTWLYGPIQPGPGASDCTGITDDQWVNGPAKEQFTYSIDGSRNGGNYRQWLSSVQLWQPGCYAWQHHIQLTPSGATADSSPAGAGETILIIQPQISTTINTNRGTAGSYLSDTMTIAGTYGQPVHISGQLQQTPPGYISRVPSCTGVSGLWDNPTPVASITAFTVTGDGEHPVPGSWQASTTGCYSFAYHVSVMVARVGTATTDLAVGAPTETALIDTPTAATTTPGTVAPASTIPSSVTISGLHLAAGDTAVLRSWYLGTAAIQPAGPTGSNPCLPAAIRAQLPTAGQRDPSGCTTTGWENTAIADTLPAITVTGNGTYPNTPILAPNQAGYGTFVQALTYNGVTTLITAPGEQGSVVQAAGPSIATTARSQPIDNTAGTATLSDALTVSGLHIQPGDHATVTAHVQTTQPGSNGCTDVDWANPAQDSTATSLDIASDGQYSTSPVTVQAGCHTFTETLTINGHQVTTNAEQPGQPSETLLTAPTITPAPTDTASPVVTSSPPATSTPSPTDTASPVVTSSPPATSTASPTDSSTPAGTSSPPAPSTSPAPPGSPAPTSSHTAVVPSSADPARSTPAAAVPAVSDAQQLPFTGVRIQAAGGLALLLILGGAALLGLAKRPRTGRHRG